MRFERLVAIPLTRLGLDADMLDGPFVHVASDSWGLMLSLRGKEGGALLSPSELVWSRELPPAAREAEVHVFVRQRDESALYLGAARRTKGRRLALAEPLPEQVWRDVVAAANAPPPPPPEQAIAALTPASTTDDRLAALRVFMVRRFGCNADAAELTIPAPRPLRVLLGLSGSFARHNRIALTRDDDRLVFYVENQGVFTWATDLEGDDPPVHVRSDGEWKLECSTLSEFLLCVAIVEAVFADKHLLMGTLRRRLPRLPLPTKMVLCSELFAKNGTIGFIASQTAFVSGDEAALLDS